VHLHARGSVYRDAVTGEWAWVDLTSSFFMPGKPVGPRVEHTDDRLFRYRRKPP
jgi:hypothetical protein